MHLLIVGTGYVGLVTGACFAEMGHHVTCLDIDRKKIDTLKKGLLPFYEPGLEELVKRNQEGGRLFFTDDYSTSAAHSAICFIAVSTPSKEDGSCNLDAVIAAARAIANAMSKDCIIVIKSTVPVGTCHRIKEEIAAQLKKRQVSHSFSVVSNPEFLKEGSALADCMKPDRIILGIDNREILPTLRELYAPFTVQHDRILIMDPASAEMAKYAANSMLAARISFMNELSGLCEKLGANINDVRIGIGSDERIGYQFLYAGAGFGGSCFPKDLLALQAMAREVHYDTPILSAVEKVNCRQKKVLSQKINAHFGDQLKGATIAIWGLSFKPNTDDLREAPSLILIEELLKAGAQLRLYDPIANSKAKELFSNTSNLYWASDEYDAAHGADAIALVTEWKQFRFIDFEKILPQMRGRAFFDGRNQYKAQEMRLKGFNYFGIGIP